MNKPTNYSDFEEIVRCCAETKFKQYFTRLGRSGQNQYGGDIISQDGRIVIQCKCFGKLTYRDLVSKITGADTKPGDYKKACNHYHEIRTFVVATTLDSDNPTQAKLRDIQEEIPILPLFWEDIALWYEKYQEKYQMDSIRRDLSQEIQAVRDNHPSFALMTIDDIDKRLFANLESNSRYLEEIELEAEAEKDIPVSPIWQRIRKTWEENENSSVIIEGEGGIGKTVALFSITKATQEYSPAPAIYIPLHKLVDNSGSCRTISDFIQEKFPLLYREIDAIAKHPWDGPFLLLLLDGFNEVPSIKRKEVLELVKDWSQFHNGAQIIISSRPMDNITLETSLFGNPIPIKLKRIEKQNVKSYLAVFGIAPPCDSDPVWEVLVYPLFLILFIKTGEMGCKDSYGFPLEIKRSTNRSSIIWNYLQRELLRKKSEDWVLRCAITCEYVLPYIAYQMVSNNVFSITEEEVRKLIDVALKSFSVKNLPSHLRIIDSDYYNDSFNTLSSFVESIKPNDWYSTILRDTGILKLVSTEEQPGLALVDSIVRTKNYTFIHQSFRDCLAAVYLVTQAENARDSILPEAWMNYIAPDALHCVAELMEYNQIKMLWEANRQHKPTNKGTTIGLLELLRIRGNGLLPAGLNFSGMDITGINLCQFISWNNSSRLFTDPSCANGTTINRAVFQKEGHSEPVVCLGLLSDGRIVSGSYDNTLRVWDPITGQCYQKLAGHKNWVSCIAVFPHKRIASASYDWSIRVWNADTGECLRTLNGHEYWINCLVAVSENCAVSGSSDKTLRIWNINTGECLQILEGHTNTVHCVCVLPDGRIASGSSDNTIRIWNIVSGQCEAVLSGHEGWIRCITALSKHKIASGSTDGTIRIWDLRDGACKTLTGHTAAINCISALPDERIVSGSSDKTLRIWDSKYENSMVLNGHTGAVKDIAVLPGHKIASASIDSSIRIWNDIDGVCLDKLDGHEDKVNCVIVHTNGSVVSGSSDSTVRVWGLGKNPSFSSPKEFERNINNTIIISEGYAASDSADFSLHIWDTNGYQRERQLLGHSGKISCIAKLANDRFVSGSWDKSLRIWGKNSSDSLFTLSGHTAEVSCAVAFPDERIVSGSFDKTLRIWDSSNGRCLFVLQGHENRIKCVAAISNGRAVSGSYDNSIRVWDVKTGAPIACLFGHTKGVSCIISSENDEFVSGSDDRTVRLWDSTIYKCLQVFEGHLGPVNCLSLLPNGQIVSGADDYDLRIWDRSLCHSVRIMKGHSWPVLCVVVLANGLIVSGSSDNTIRVWDSVDGKCIRTLLGHTARVNSIQVLSGNTVLSASKDNTIRIWNIDTGKCIEVLEAPEVNVKGMDFSKADVAPDYAKVLRQNGAIV